MSTKTGRQDVQHVEQWWRIGSDTLIAWDEVLCQLKSMDSSDKCSNKLFQNVDFATKIVHIGIVTFLVVDLGGLVNSSVLGIVRVVPDFFRDAPSV
jgi:hypothetical protein